MPLDSLPLDASGLPHVESKGVAELDMAPVVARAKKNKTTKSRQRVYDNGSIPKTDGFAFPSTAAELEETREIEEPKKALIHRRVINREQLKLLQTVFHSPGQLEKAPPARTAKIGLVATGIIAGGGNPNYHPSKNIP
jgi:hypothetical protein